MSSDETQKMAEENDPEDIIRTCPNCGKKLADHKCKLICECGYYASCSDYL
jgi:hypothetical protein